MKLPSNNSPVWIVIRNFQITLVLFLCLYFGYNQFDPFKDVRSILIVGIALGSFDFLKFFLAPKTQEISGDK